MYSGNTYSTDQYSGTAVAALSTANPPGTSIDDICLDPIQTATTVSHTTGAAGQDIDDICN